MSPEWGVGGTGMEDRVRRIIGELTLWFVGLSQSTAILRTVSDSCAPIVWIQQRSELGFVRRKKARVVPKSA